MTSKSGVENDSRGWRLCGNSSSSHRRSQGNGVMCHPMSQPHFSLYLAWKIPSPPFFYQLILILVPGTAKTYSPSSLRYDSLKFFRFFFFNVNHFQKLYWICYSLLLFYVLVFGLQACGILAQWLWPGIKHTPACIGRWNLNSQTARKVLEQSY